MSGDHCHHRFTGLRRRLDPAKARRRAPTTCCQVAVVDRTNGCRPLGGHERSRDRLDPCSEGRRRGSHQSSVEISPVSQVSPGRRAAHLSRDAGQSVARASLATRPHVSSLGGTSNQPGIARPSSDWFGSRPMPRGPADPPPSAGRHQLSVTTSTLAHDPRPAIARIRSSGASSNQLADEETTKAEARAPGNPRRHPRAGARWAMMSREEPLSTAWARRRPGTPEMVRYSRARSHAHVVGTDGPSSSALQTAPPSRQPVAQ